MVILFFENSQSIDRFGTYQLIEFSHFYSTNELVDSTRIWEENRINWMFNEKAVAVEKHNVFKRNNFNFCNCIVCWNSFLIIW